MAATPAAATAAGSTDIEYKRVELPYTPMYQRFVLKDRKFASQFSHVYLKRLLQLRPACVAAAQKKWAADGCSMAANLNAVQATGTWIVVATIYKTMSLRPSMIDEYANERGGSLTEVKDCYISNDDAIIAEDDSGRVVCVGSIPARQMVTGAVLALKCQLTADGELNVLDTCAAGVPVPKPLPATAEGESSPYVLLVSGLDDGTGNCLLPLQLLAEFVTGRSGSADEQLFASRIARVIVCGGMVKQDDAELADHPLSTAEQDKLAQPMQRADRFIAQLASSVPVDVMAGQNDPSDYTLPQQPLHVCMFPHAARYSTLRMVTNPYDCDIGGVRFLGSSGQPIDSFLRFAEPQTTDPDLAASCAVPIAEDAPPMVRNAGAWIGALETSLRWRIVAPTAPDTLACYPFVAEDPFVLTADDAPHVYFAGNAPAFASTLLHASADAGRPTLLVAVPCFASTKTAVLVDVHHLTCLPLVFEGIPDK